VKGRAFGRWRLEVGGEKGERSKVKGNKAGKPGGQETRKQIGWEACAAGCWEVEKLGR